MEPPGQWVTLREGNLATAVIAPELGGWLLRYSRQLPGHGSVDAIHFSQAVVDRYPLQMYAGNPLLFPIASFSRASGQEHHYEWRGKIYAMPQHGFARRVKWNVAEVTETAVALEMSDTPETRQNYPFSFLCRVQYALREGRLHFRQTIENRGRESMPFSAGIHPYFNVPPVAGGHRNDCFLELPRACRVIPDADWSGWKSEPSPARRLPVGEDVSGTWFFTDFADPEISLVDPNARVKITLNFADAPAHRFVALWSKSVTEPFYCIEPWTALPNPFARENTELILLEPGQVFRAGMWISVGEIS